MSREGCENTPRCRTKWVWIIDDALPSYYRTYAGHEYTWKVGVNYVGERLNGGHWIDEQPQGTAMTDEQIKELFDTVPAFADSCIESLRPAPFLRSISRCWSASVKTGLMWDSSQPQLSRHDMEGTPLSGRKDAENIRLFTVNPEYYLNLERFRAPS